MSVLLGKGDRTFQPAIRYRNFPPGGRLDYIFAGDLSSDGLPDLVTASIGYLGDIIVLLGNGGHS